MKYIILSSILSLILLCFAPTSSIAKAIESKDAIELSVDLLQMVKQNKNTELGQIALSSLKEDDLHQQLSTPIQKQVFWINIYNAYIQILLKEEPQLYEDRSSFFSKERIKIAGQLLSFDDIEHGILRASTWKLSLGYVQNPFAPAFETKFRLSKTDPRIHFALNCGARSCPPIAIYTEENYNSKVNEVAKYFLNKESEVDLEGKVVHTTPLFSWFRGDFGGSSGIRKTLIQYEVLKKNSGLEIEYKDYDWTLDLSNYYE